MKFYSKDELEQLLQCNFQFNELDNYIESTKNEEFHTFLVHLKTENASIFYDWIHQWKELYQLLTSNKQVVFKDVLKLNEHQLFESFKHFLSPFLLERLNQQIKELEFYPNLQFLVLLDVDSRNEFEQSIHQQLQDKFSALEVKLQHQQIEEQLLLDFSQDYLSQQKIELLNSFSNVSYFSRVQYIENNIKIIESNSCTTRLANWIVKQLKQLNLKPEHIEQLEKLQNDIQSGTIRFTKKTKTRSFNLQKSAYFLLLIIFVFVVAWIVVYKPFSSTLQADKHTENTSSFQFLTIQERQAIDSLIQQYKPTIDSVFYLAEDHYWEGRELMVNGRRVLNNQLADEFYETWEQFLAQDSIPSQDLCEKQAKLLDSTQIPSNFKHLVNKTNGKVASFRNESEFDIQLVVFNQSKNGNAYYVKLTKNMQVQFHLTDNDVIGVIAGKYAVIYKDSLAEGIVFCEYDNVTLSSLMTFYEFHPSNDFSYKFLITGKNIYNFQVIDMYQALTKYQ